jgi:tetratricopeptide (TPR) repeat protein
VTAGLRARLGAEGLAVWLTALVVWAALRPGEARANDFDQFQNARVAYESLNYALAADLFQGLLATAAPADRRPVVIESRKYLAAAYLFLGRKPEAEAQLEQLLRAAPDYVLDPLAFPDEVARTFATVKKRLERQQMQDQQARAREDATKRGQQELAVRQQRDRLQRLIELASTQRVEEVRSRWIAMVPFGVGQFQNDHNGLGLVLAVSEGALLAISVTSFFLHESLRGQVPTADMRDNARLAEATFRYTNQLSAGLFAVLAVTGVIDAQVRFVPSRSYDERRPLPPDLLKLQVSAGPTGLGLAARW